MPLERSPESSRSFVALLRDAPFEASQARQHRHHFTTLTCRARLTRSPNYPKVPGPDEIPSLRRRAFPCALPRNRSVRSQFLWGRLPSFNRRKHHRHLDSDDLVTPTIFEINQIIVREKLFSLFFRAPHQISYAQDVGKPAMPMNDAALSL